MYDDRSIIHLSADRPVESLKEDRLGRGQFCIQMATAIQRWHRPEGLVIGIDGPWGSGKSSVKNMVLECLRKAEPRPTVVEFNPWYWSGQDRLLAAFFEEIGSALGRPNGREANDSLARKWKAYATRLVLGGTVLAQLAGAAESIDAPQWFSAILGSLALASTASGDVASKGADAHSASAEQEEFTLEQLKREVAEDLIEREQPILVVIDDVDRLTAEEVRLLFRLVKANADFPRVIYLLLYDRSVVESALDEDYVGRGRSYLEKIVQVPFSLPGLNETAIQDALFEGIGEIAGKQPLLHDLDNRSYGIYDRGVRLFFRSLRDVHRFLSTLSFHAALFPANDVNMADLCAIEVLRTFEPAVHRNLPQHKELLVSGFDDWGTGERYEDWRKRRLAEFRSVISLASEPNRKHVQSLLTMMFPQVDALLRSVQDKRSGFTSDLRDRCIYRKDMFDRYITFVMPAGEVPHSIVKSILETVGKVQSLEQSFRGLYSEKRLTRALELLHSHLDSPRPQELVTLATALFNSCDEVSDEEDAEEEYVGAVANVLDAIFGLESVPERRNQALLDALAESIGVRLPVFYVKSQFVAGTTNPDTDRFSSETLATARRICCERLSLCAERQLLSLPQLATHLRLWREWSDGVELDGWLEEALKQPKNAFLLACGFCRNPRRQGFAYMHLGDLYAVSEKVEWVELLRQFFSEPVDAENAALTAVFSRSAEAIRSSISGAS